MDFSLLAASSFVVLAIAGLLLLIARGLSRKETGKMTEKTRFAIPDDQKLAFQRQFLSKDKLDVELSIEAFKNSTVAINGKLSFFIRNTSSMDGDRQFYLDCSIAARPLKLKFNSKTVSADTILDNRIEISQNLLKVGKNVLEISYDISLNSNFIQGLNCSQNRSLVSNSSGLQSFSRIMPCINHPSVDYEVSISMICPKNQFFMVSSLGQAFSRLEGNKQILITNKKQIKTQNLGIAYIREENFKLLRENYENLTIEWFISFSSVKKATSLLEDWKKTLHILLEEHLKVLAIERDQTFQIVISDDVKTSVWTNFSIIHISDLLSGNGLFQLMEVISCLLIRSLDKRIPIESLESFHFFQRLSKTYTKLLFKKVQSRTFETLSPASELEYTSKHWFSSSLDELPWEPLNNTEEALLKNFFGEILFSDLTSFYRQDEKIQVKVTSESEVYVKWPQNLAKNGLGLQILGPQSFRRVDNWDTTTQKTGTIVKLEQILKEDEVLVSMDGSILVSQPLDRISQDSSCAVGWDIVLKTQLLRQAFTIKDIDLNKFVNSLLEILQKIDSNTRPDQIKVVINTIGILISQMKQVAKTNKIASFQKTLKEILRRNLPVSDVAEDTIKKLEANENIASKFADNVFESFSVHSLEDIMQNLSSVLPIVIDQQEMSRQLDKLRKTDLPKTYIKAIEEALKKKRIVQTMIFDIEEYDSGSYLEENLSIDDTNNLKIEQKSLKELKKTTDKSISLELFGDGAAKGSPDTKLKLFENQLDTNQEERDSQDQNCFSDSDKIENILNKLSEYCDSNLDLNDQEHFHESPLNQQNCKSKFSGRSGGSGEVSMRSLLINQSALHNLSAISHNTKDSTRVDGNSSEYKHKRTGQLNLKQLNNSESKDPNVRSGKNRRKPTKAQPDQLLVVRTTSEQLSHSVQSGKSTKKVGTMNKLKIKKIQEEDCEYTPKNKEPTSNRSSHLSANWTEIEKLLKEWTVDFEKEVKHFIELDLKGIKLKYLEARESPEAKDKLLDYISNKFYANCISVYLLMRARKKSDINSICSLLSDCGIVNSISFPQDKLRTVVEEVATSRNLNLRFKRSSFIDMLVRVAFERYYELGEADNPVESVQILWMVLKKYIENKLNLPLIRSINEAIENDKEDSCEVLRILASAGDLLTLKKHLAEGLTLEKSQVEIIIKYIYLFGDLEDGSAIVENDSLKGRTFKTLQIIMGCVLSKSSKDGRPISSVLADLKNKVN